MTEAARAYDLATVVRIYSGSNGSATLELYGTLTALGPRGVIALNLFRACKTSERAKGYRRRAHREASYETKGWALDNLCKELATHGVALGIVWGWGYDRSAVCFEHVLYVDIPTGQCSFHNQERLAGADYPSQWDRMRGATSDRIIRWVVRLLSPPSHIL